MKKLLLTFLMIIALQMQGQCWKEAAVGEDHAAAIAADGKLWSWGWNFEYALGYAYPTSYLPGKVNNDADWKSVDAGSQYTIIQKNDGSIWCTGRKSFMQLAKTAGFNAPLSQVNMGNEWKSFSCSRNFVLFIKNDGTLWAWGADNNGNTGSGETANQAFTFPVQISNDNDWKEIDAGPTHSLAIKNDGTLWMWGRLDWTVQNSQIYEPTQVGTDNDWKMISAGSYTAAAIKNNETLWVWGMNGYGQLGIGNAQTQSLPVQLGTDLWLSVDAGFLCMHGVKADGSLWGWGDNSSGQLGNGEPANPGNGISEYLPVPIFAETGWKTTGSKFANYTLFISDDHYLKSCGSYGPHLGIGDYEAIIEPNPTSINCANTASLNNNTLNQLSVYPNPVSDVLYLANADERTIENISVYDVSGKVVVSQNSTANQVDVSQLPQGIYFLKITTANGTSNHKFIKQ